MNSGGLILILMCQEKNCSQLETVMSWVVVVSEIRLSFVPFPEKLD